MTTLSVCTKTEAGVRARLGRIRQEKPGRKQRGFSLLEMLFVVAILMLVMAVVFDQITQVQKRSRVEEMKVDMTQESREFMDQLVRDMHSIGYPTKSMYPNGATINDGNVAAGLVKIAYDELWFEGDVDGNGSVDVIDYKLQPDANGNCPCTIARSQYPKVGGTALMSQTTNAYSMSLSGVVNSGAGGTGNSTGTPAYTISGTSLSGTSNNTIYSSYKSANVFTYFDAAGNEILPTNVNLTPLLSQQVRTIQININVLAPQNDLQTGVRPVMSYSAAVRMPNQ